MDSSRGQLSSRGHARICATCEVSGGAVARFARAAAEARGISLLVPAAGARRQHASKAAEVTYKCLYCICVSMRRLRQVLALAEVYVRTGAVTAWDELESWWLCAATEVSAERLRLEVSTLFLRGERAAHVCALVAAPACGLPATLRF